MPRNAEKTGKKEQGLVISRSREREREREREKKTSTYTILHSFFSLSFFSFFFFVLNFHTMRTGAVNVAFFLLALALGLAMAQLPVSNFRFGN